MKKIVCILICALTAVTACASDFFSTERSEKFITFGARVGVNTSNRTIDESAFPYFYNKCAWGTGFDIGAVVNLNFRDYLSVQPGIMYESRTSRYTLIGNIATLGYIPGVETAQGGKISSYSLTIPVMAIVGFNVTDNLRWTVEVGPYVSFVLDSKNTNGAHIITYDPLFVQKTANVDFGFKLGTGLRLLGHYYVGAHYMAGCVDSWQKLHDVGLKAKNFGGRTKAWVFTLGYDF